MSVLGLTDSSFSKCPSSFTHKSQVRMFKTIDLDALEYTFFDGKNYIPCVNGDVEHVEEYRKVLVAEAI